MDTFCSFVQLGQNIPETSEPHPKLQNRRPEPRKQTKHPNFGCLGVFNLDFFGTVRLFQFFLPSMGPIFKIFFNILQQTKMPKSPKGLPFYVFRHYENVQNSQFFCFFFAKIKEKIRHFFVSFDNCFDILLFDILQQTGISKYPKGPRIYRFKNFALFEP